MNHPVQEFVTLDARRLVFSKTCLRANVFLFSLLGNLFLSTKYGDPCLYTACTSIAHDPCCKNAYKQHPGKICVLLICHLKRMLLASFRTDLGKGEMMYDMALGCGLTGSQNIQDVINSVCRQGKDQLPSSPIAPHTCIKFSLLWLLPHY